MDQNQSKEKIVINNLIDNLNILVNKCEQKNITTTTTTNTTTTGDNDNHQKKNEKSSTTIKLIKSDSMSKLLIKSKSKSKLSSPSSLSCLTTMKSVIIESNISDQQQQHQQQQQSIIKNIQSISSISRSGSVSVNGKSSSLITLKTSSSSETIVETYLRRKHLEPLEIIGEGGFST